MYSEPASDWNPVSQHQHIDKLTAWLALTLSFYNGYISEFSYLCNKIKIQLKEGRVLFGSQFERTLSVIAGKVWLQKHEAAGHIVFVVKKQWAMNVDSLIFLSFLFSSSIWTPSKRDGAIQIQGGS